jgi:curved DNA-binding protein CbpA
MDEKPDYYRQLGVDRWAEPAAIHSAYRDLAWRFHPDKIGDDATMKLINAAWDVLRDAGRRALYDAGLLPLEGPIPAPASSVEKAQPSGPPPGRASGPVLDFGRYKGWSLGEVGRVNPDYLEWLRRAPGYRWLQADVDAVLSALDLPSSSGRGSPA